MSMDAAEAADDAGDVPDAIVEERRNVRNLLRMVGLFAMFPGWTIILAFAVIDLNEHLLHIGALLPFAAAGTFAFVAAERLAVRFVPTT